MTAVQAECFGIGKGYGTRILNPSELLQYPMISDLQAGKVLQRSAMLSSEQVSHIMLEAWCLVRCVMWPLVIMKSLWPCVISELQCLAKQTAVVNSPA